MTGATTHPTPEQLAALVGQDLSERERAPLVAHLGECRECAQAVKLALALEDDASALADEWTAEPTRVGFAPGRWLPGLALAATVAFALVAVWPSLEPTSDEPAIRGAAADVVPQPGAVLSDAPSRFVWPSSSSGHVVITDDVGSVLFRSGPMVPPWRPSSEVADRLDGAGTYYWRIELPNATLGPYVFVVE